MLIFENASDFWVLFNPARDFIKQSHQNWF